MEDFNNNNLSLISYNCQHADELRLPFLQNLFDNCDFLLLQEHSLYQSKLGWFNEIGSNDGNTKVRVGIHGVSAMDESKPLHGRPNGGAVILWHETLVGHINPVSWDSKRFCAVTYNTGDNIILIICVYMPCDDWRNDGNVIEYIDILNEIYTLSVNIKADYICIGGDFNTDLSRNTQQTNILKSFVADNHLSFCALSNASDIEYTLKSKINDKRSFIDHFLLSKSLSCKLSEFTSIDDINNKSDHIAIKCSIDINITYSHQPKLNIHTNQPRWKSANEFNIELYKEILDSYFLSIPLPLELINCKNNMCTSHQEAIASFHDKIVNVLVMASDNSIPIRVLKLNLIL